MDCDSSEEVRQSSQTTEFNSENSDHIMKEFNVLKSDIEQQLEGLKDIKDKAQTETLLNELTDKFEKINKFINDSSLYLPKYNQKSAQNMLNSIRNEIETKKSSLVPKFSFKTGFKANHQKSKAAPKAKVEAEPVDQVDHAAQAAMPFFGFKNTRDRNDLRLSGEESAGKDIQLENLIDCCVEVRGPANALKINNLENCKIFCGPITTSALISNCKKCQFRIASQQLRTYMSSDCDIYLHVTSRAIIEDSTRIRFAAYDWNYQSIAEDFKSADLDINTNNWQQIDDFDCLSSDKPSKNWSLIDSN